jgi:hypothetical protein
LIFSELIFDPRDRFRNAALGGAPDGPAKGPPLSRRAASIISTLGQQAYEI